MDLDADRPASPDSSSSSSSTTPKLYPLAEIQAHNDSVCSVSFSPLSPEIYASGGIDDQAFLFLNSEAKDLPGHSDSIISVSFSSCGEYLAVASMDSSVSVWNAANGDLISRFTGPTEEVLSLSWHPRLPSICVLSNDCSLWIWHMRKNSPVAVIYGHPLNLAFFAPLGRFIYAAGKDGGLKVWDLKAENFDSSPPYLTVAGRDLPST
jgi:angio-associated migratory cell protein